jgi:formylglycine-generating enzyme required for sulfatase activity
MSASPVRRLALLALCALLFALLLLPALLLPDVAAQSPTPTAPPTPTLTPTPTWWQFAAPDWVEPLPGYGGWAVAIIGVMILFALLVAFIEGVREAVKDFSKAAVEQTVGRLFSRNRARQRSYLACLRERYGKIKPLGIARHDRVLLDIGEIHVPLRIEAPRQAGFRGALDAAFDDSGRRHQQGFPFHAFTLLSDAKLLPQPDQDWTERLGALRDRLLRRQRSPQRRMPDDHPPPLPKSCPRLLLLGVAGSGKTTTLRYAAIRVAEAWTRRRNRALKLDDLGLYLPRPPLPIYVRLVAFSRAYADTTPDPEDLLTWIDQELADWHLRDMRDFSAAIRQNRCLLLFDGLDEAGDEERRATIAGLLAQLAERYPGNRYLVASRPAGYGGAVHLADFQAVTLDALNADEARSIMRKWFSVAIEQEQRAAQESNRLWSAINRNARLRQMADRPLLVIAMAALHFDETTLPDERARLYEVLIELLLGKWFLRRLESANPEDEERARRLRDERPRIEDLAFLMQCGDNQASEVTLDQAQDWLAPGYGAAHHPDAARHRVYNLLETLDLDSGLMQRRAADTYAFAHLSFQEYLAACALDELDKTRQRGAGVTFLLAQSHEQRWREVTLLAAGRWSSGRDIDLSAHLVTGLLEQDTASALELAADMLTDIRPEKLPALREAALTCLLAQGSNHLLLRAGEALHDNWQHTPEQRRETLDRLRTCAWHNPPVEADPALRQAAVVLLDRLDADARPDLDLTHPDYWATPIEPGTFSMGDDQGWQDNEKPQFDATIQRRYALARFPVTNRQYLLFIEALDERGPPEAVAAARRLRELMQRHKQTPEQFQPRFWPGTRYPDGAGNQPVVEVTWYAASAFAWWADAWLHAIGVLSPEEDVRLPTEAEWERAAAYPPHLPGGSSRAGRRNYPWGDWTDREQAEAPPIPANISESGLSGPSAVGIFPHGAAACGAEELAGNVWEWCSSRYQDYPLPPDLPAETYDTYRRHERTKRRFVLRGGSWDHYRPDARCACRYDNSPGVDGDFLGFRLARLFSLSSSS